MQFNYLKQKCQDLAIKYPDKNYLFDNYIERQRYDINWLDIDRKSLKNTLKNPNNEQQNFIMLVSLFSQESVTDPLH